MTADTRPPVVLPRSFGFWTGLWVVVASMVGTGVLTTSGFTLQQTESHATLLGLWALGGILSLAGATALAELATAYPESGGEYIYVRHAFGAPSAFSYGWATFLLGFATPTAIIALGSVKYLLGPWRHILAATLPAGAVPQVDALLASVIIAVFTAIHCLGHKESAWTQAASTVFKFGTLVLMALLALAFGQGRWDGFAEGTALGDQQSTVLASNLVRVMYGYAGWNAVVYLAGEVRDPPRQLPRCLVGGCAVVTGLYLLVNLCYVFAIPATALRGLPEEAVGPVAMLAANRLFQIDGLPIASVNVGLSLIIGFGMLSSVSAFLLSGARVAFALARDGLFPAFAGSVHARRQTPAAAMLTMGAVSLVLVWAGGFRQLLDAAGVALTLLSAITILCVFPLRGRPSYQPTFRMPLFPWPAVLFLAMTLWMTSLTLVNTETRGPALGALAAMAAGYPVFFVVKAMRR